MDYIQNILFPINDNNKAFIYPDSLKYKLPRKVIDIIQPSQKHIPPFSNVTLLNAIERSNNKYIYQYHQIYIYQQYNKY